MSDELDALSLERHDLLFSVRRSIRYHNRRRMFFDRLNKVSTFLSALFGTATVASALSRTDGAWTIAFAVLVAVFSVIDLVVGTAQAARQHYDLARRFIELEKCIVCLKDPTEKDLVDLRSR